MTLTQGLWICKSVFWICYWFQLAHETLYYSHVMHKLLQQFMWRSGGVQYLKTGKSEESPKHKFVCLYTVFRIPVQDLPSSQSETNDASEVEEPSSESTDSTSNSASSNTVSSSLSKHPVNIWLSLLFTAYCLLLFSSTFLSRLLLTLFFLCSRSQSLCPTWVLWCCGRSWRASWRTRASRLSPHLPLWTTIPLSSGIWCGFSAGWSCPAACPPLSLAPSTAARTCR